MSKYNLTALGTILALSGGLMVSAPANAADATANADVQATANLESESNSHAQNLVGDAVDVVQTMKTDEDLSNLLSKAKGVFIVPNFGKGAFIVGGRGGEGVVLARNGDQWSDPAFYNLGGISIGAQLGGEGGSIAMLLMTDKAVDAFKGPNNFSLNPGAGISIVTYSAADQASWGKGDIILWSNTSGAFAGAQVSLTDVAYDSSETENYYNEQSVTADQVLDGKVTTAKDDALQAALPG